MLSSGIKANVLFFLVYQNSEHTFMGNMTDFIINCNSSARAIRKTALRAYCGYRHCFTHLQALSS